MPRPARTTAAADEVRALRRVIWRDFAFGVAVMVVLIFAHSRVERAWFAEPLRNYWLGVSQRFFAPRNVPVVVYDAHDLRPVAQAAGDTDLRTPRGALEDLIHAVAMLSPAAIGIDIDLSPVGGGLTASDRAFYDWVLSERQQEQVPIYLGVYRTTALPPALWLHDERYASLAAALTLPENPTYLFATLGDPNGAIKPTMGLALGAAYNRASRSATPAPQRFIATLAGLPGRSILRDVTETESDGQALEGLGYLVDYSVLPRIDVQRVHVDGDDAHPKPSIATDQTLSGKIVLIGDARPADDPVLVPWQRKLVAGVLLHASGAYTLAIDPLYELTTPARIALDAITTILALGVVAGARFAYVARRGVRVRYELLKGMLSWTFAIVLLVLCLWIVHSSRIIWDDFVLVAILIVAHPAAERWFEAFARGTRRSVPAMWNAVFVEREPGEAAE